MKVLSTEGLTKLIQLIKSAFISVDDTVSTNTVTLATVATSGSYTDLSDKPTIPDTTNLANKDLSNLSSTGEARFDAKVSKSACVEVYPVIQTYQSGASWYRIYSDGWCEQGGRITPSTTGSVTVTLLKTFKDTNYSIQTHSLDGGTSSTGTPSNRGVSAMSAPGGSWTTSNITYTYINSGWNYSWEARGYLAEGEY